MWQSGWKLRALKYESNTNTKFRSANNAARNSLRPYRWTLVGGYVEAKQMKMWTNQSSLFDLPAALEARDTGIKAAASQRSALVVLAREIAVMIAARDGSVNADQVVAEMVRRGYGIHALGNAAGSIFRDRRFRFTGRFVQSERVHARGNMLREWRLA